MLNVTYINETIIPIKEDPLVANDRNKIIFSFVIKNINTAKKITNMFVKNPHNKYILRNSREPNIGSTKFVIIIINKHENNIEKKEGSWKIEDKRTQNLGIVKKKEAGISTTKWRKFGSIEKNETIRVDMHMNLDTLVNWTWGIAKFKGCIWTKNL